MSNDRKQKKAGQFTLAVSVIFAICVGSFLTWLFWPWPSITATSDATLQNLPEDGIYETGDLVIWTKSEVCQPAGESTAEIWAVRAPRENEPIVELKTLVSKREFSVSDTAPDCNRNNSTSAYISGILASGTYRFEIRACLKNPTPVPKCNTFQGPDNVKIRRISNNMPVIQP